MGIRTYKSRYCKQITELFYETVHSINSKDYTKKQLDAWASKDIDLNLWDELFLKSYTLIFTINDTIVGFGNLSLNGYLDKLFTHKDYQRKGVAKEIVKELEIYAKESGLNIITTEASITAKPFFEKQGYHAVEEEQVERKGQLLVNYKMRKYLQT